MFFIIDKLIIICGSGIDIVIFVVIEFLLIIRVLKVWLENLIVEWIVGGDNGEVVIFVEININFILS